MPVEASGQSEHTLEARELKARVELPWVRGTFDTCGYSYTLVIYAIERQLKETGIALSHCL